MSDNESAAPRSGSTEYAAFPPGGGGHERAKLLLLTFMLVAPLGSGIQLLSLELLAYAPETQDVRLTILIGCLAIVVFVAQAGALLKARSSISADRINLLGIARVKPLLMLLSVVAVAAAPLLIVAAVLGIGWSGFVGAGTFLGLGVFGLLGALQLGKIERFFAGQSASSRATG